jgi:hypothetical protein
MEWPPLVPAENGAEPIAFNGNAPDRIRTCGLDLRRVALYPAELRALTSQLSQSLERMTEGEHTFCPAADIKLRHAKTNEWERNRGCGSERFGATRFPCSRAVRRRASLRPGRSFREHGVPSRPVQDSLAEPRLPDLQFPVDRPWPRPAVVSRSSRHLRSLFPTKPNCVSRAHRRGSRFRGQAAVGPTLEQPEKARAARGRL